MLEPAVSLAFGAVPSISSLIELWRRTQDRAEPLTAEEIEEAVIQPPPIQPPPGPVLLSVAADISQVIRDNVNGALDRLKKALGDPSNTQQDKDKEVKVAQATICAELERLRRLNNGQLPGDLHIIWNQFGCG
jgi:hypothetical protein